MKCGFYSCAFNDTEHSDCLLEEIDIDGIGTCGAKLILSDEQFKALSFKFSPIMAFTQEPLSIDDIDEGHMEEVSGDTASYIARSIRDNPNKKPAPKEKPNKDDGRPSKEQLTALYVEEMLSAKEIADKLNIPLTKIKSYLRMHDITRNRRNF